MTRKTELVFAPMQVDDFDEVQKLWLECDGVMLDARSDSREQIQFFLQRNPELSQVVRAGSQIVAVVLCGHDGRRGYLSHLAVHPDYRRAGLARRMVQKSLVSLAAAGVPGCNIRLSTKNELGRAFWKKSDWQPLEVEVWIADTPH